ncbi:ATP-grasp domain-containing protein [Pseudomonas syringae]|uniref:ATP-grasp domain-containing protein n=1 Tax=Pseudomonas syringae pv. aptata TaxID=83167 RepID=A0A0Q0CGF8_PSEAP|nr:ATP-grasp domain-containing protein [Pseudomonas syringae]KFF83317.1 hypothetical protein HM80_12910 [Pseudomonas syringae pv. syringae]KPZ03650.1 hypothetical protein ALO85_200160 [Pseudomonas syringae pv. aptata]MBS7436380.1 ATP-grasp domain-containing protein [Pseudomonas syringae]MBS7460121.1 ATP-grasp domain-containing protein [Pseudomonas syringae]MBS7470255.1 ATP-grasp domain-containing protein [Pseudomonas syringae]
MTKGAIVVIDPVSSGRRYGLEILQKGYTSVALVTRTKFPGRLHRLFSSSDFQEVIFSENLIDSIEKLSLQNVKAIVPGSDSALKFCDTLAEHLGLTGNPVRTQKARYSKLEMKRALKLNNVPTTGVEALSLDTARKSDLSFTQFPVVVKPTQGTGSKNVKVCHNVGDIYRALSLIESTNESFNSGEKEALIEPYIVGKEYCVAIANFGKGNDKELLCIAEYEKIQINNNPSIYKNIRSVRIDDDLSSRIFDYATRVNMALEADYGINDIELKVDGDDIQLIEQNGRLPGADLPRMIELCTGRNLYQVNIDIYLGLAGVPRVPVEYKKHFCVCCLINFESGLIDRIEGVAEIEKLSSFQDMNIIVSEAEIIEPTHDFLSTWGFVFLLHDDAETLMQHSKMVHEHMKIIYKV